MTYANGDKEVLYFKDFSSGAMIESVVRRAKKLALKRYIASEREGHQGRGPAVNAVREEFKENEDLPNTTNPDDWAKIAGKKGERIVYVKPLMGETQGKAARRRAGHQLPASTCKPRRREGAPAAPSPRLCRRRLRSRADARVDAVGARTSWRIPKVMGIETEYGITVKNQPDFNPILSSLLLINSYETYRSSRIRWDYEAESPLRDARGFEYMEEKEVPSKEESRLINLILSNGARFYVDHAHPEYSSPETHQPARLRDLGPGGRAHPRPRAPARGGGRRRPSSASSSTRTTPTPRATPTAPTRTTSWTARCPSRASSST